jgi:hypothetical protein
LQILIAKDQPTLQPSVVSHNCESKELSLSKRFEKALDKLKGTK